MLLYKSHAQSMTQDLGLSRKRYCMDQDVDSQTCWGIWQYLCYFVKAIHDPQLKTYVLLVMIQDDHDLQF